MSAAISLPVTPRRKRAASRGFSSIHEACVKSESSTDTESTPDVQDLPELGWVETPEPNDGFPRTPSPSTTPSEVPASGKELRETPVRTIKQTRWSDRLKIAEPSSPSPHVSIPSLPLESAKTDQKATLIFPRHLYPSSTPSSFGDAVLFNFVKGDISPKNFQFLDPSKAPPSFNIPGGHSAASPRFTIQRPVYTLRDHLRKRVRVKDEASITRQWPGLTLTKPSLAPKPTDTLVKGETPDRSSFVGQIPTKTTVVPSSPIPKLLSTNPELTGTVLKKFTRILPFDTLERLTENPNRCIASKDRQPSERCSRPARSKGNSKDRVLDQISKNSDPLNLAASESFIRGLVGSLVCSRSHYPIASPQFDALLDRYHGRPDGNPKKSHDFTTADLRFLPTWLKALTTVPGEKSTRQAHVASEASQVQGAAIASGQASSSDATVKTETSIMVHTASVTKITKTATGVVEKTQLMAEVTTQRTTRYTSASAAFVSTQIIDVDFDFAGTAAKTTTLAKERAMISFVKSVNALDQTFCWFWPSPKQPVDQKVRKVMHRDLSLKRDASEGYIYMYWIAGSFGFVKIGVTNKDPATRLREWETKCGHKILQFTASEVGVQVKLPHVYRVEALVHAELGEGRLKEPACKKCSERAGTAKGHIEWFAISAAHAQRVIDKWSNWMMKTNPYVGGKLDTSVKIDELCSPLPLSERDAAAFVALKPIDQKQATLPSLPNSSWARRLRTTPACQRRIKSL